MMKQLQMTNDKTVGHKCRITEKLEIVSADISAYHQLARFHYRGDKLGPYEKIFAIKDTVRRGGGFGEPVGVIIYAMPVPSLELRNVATNGKYILGDRSLSMQLVNRDIRCISRVIIEPRYRGLGLASWLVRETMPLAGVAIVEALAVMGTVNPFFAKAGMTKFQAPLPERCERMIEAFSAVGIEDEKLLDPNSVQAAIDNMILPAQAFIEVEMNNFLQAYGSGARIKEGIKRVKYIVSRLSMRPSYYIWMGHNEIGN